MTKITYVHVDKKELVKGTTGQRRHHVEKGKKSSSESHRDDPVLQQ